MSETRRVAIVMSRMPRLIAPDAIWLSGLRACLRRIHENRHTLLSAPGTAGADFVLRGAQRLRIAIETYSDEPGGQKVDTDEASTAPRDRWLIESADEVFALGVRPQGNIHKLLIDRLATGRGSVSLVDLPSLQSDGLRQSLLTAGAGLWTPHPDATLPLIEQSLEDTVQAANSGKPNQDALVLVDSYPQTTGHLLLTHTTRACPGPWPRQSVDEYLDSLLDSQTSGNHSALMTLTRIVQQRLLIASGRTIRGEYPVVSFTAVPLTELPELRCFRTHRSRWDFEPYGLCIAREALARHGVQSVGYGSEQTWKTLSDSARPFFQLSGDSSAEADTAQHIDWSVEMEWRHLGDLDLSGFTREELFVFVPTFEDAKFLQPQCPWPITLWPGEKA